MSIAIAKMLLENEQAPNIPEHGLSNKLAHHKGLTMGSSGRASDTSPPTEPTRISVAGRPARVSHMARLKIERLGVEDTPTAPAPGGWKGVFGSLSRRRCGGKAPLQSRTHACPFENTPSASSLSNPNLVIVDPRLRAPRKQSHSRRKLHRDSTQRPARRRI
jgi:hypothetical protein